MVDTISIVFYCLTFANAAVGLLLNSVGIYLLTALRARISNQNVILINLSFIKVIVSISQAALYVLKIIGKGEEQGLYKVVLIILVGAFGVNHLTIVVLTLDRLLGIVIPLRYNALITKDKLRIAIIASWMIGTAAVIVPFFIYDFAFLYSIYYTAVYLTLDGIVLLIAVIAYGFILRVLLRREKAIAAGMMPRNARTHQRFGRFFYVSSLIIASFILFVAIPDVIHAVLVIFQGNKDPMIELAMVLAWSIYLVSDPLIYIFLQKPIRLKFCRMFVRVGVGIVGAKCTYNDRTL